MVITEEFDDKGIHRQNVNKDCNDLQRSFKEAGYQTFCDAKSISFDGKGNCGTFKMTASRHGNPRGQPEVLIQYAYKATERRGDLEIKIAKAVQVCIYAGASRDEQAAQTEETRKVVLPLIEMILGEKTKITAQYRYPNPDAEVEIVKELPADAGFQIAEDVVPKPFEL